MNERECDVLVIGGGLAGCWAALRAAATGARVILVEKAKVARSGRSSFSGATILYPTTRDDLDLWRQEIVTRGNYLGDQDQVEQVLQEQESRIRDMADWGVAFERDERGNLVRNTGMVRGVTRMVMVDSRQMMGALRKRLEAEKVELVEKTMITGLLTSDGCYPTKETIAGAFGFHTITGEPVAIQSRATVMATGSSQWLDMSGDGQAQAFRAGAELRSLEFSRTYDNMGLDGKYVEVHLNTYLRLGMVLLNSRGERFMERYFPRQKEEVSRHDIGLAILTEEMEGRGPVYMAPMSATSWNKLLTLPTTTRRVRGIQKEGLDFTKQKVEYNVFSGFFSLNGGIRQNIHGESNIPGLFAAGEAAGQPTQGTYSVGGMNLATCCVTGYHAGESAARYAREGPSPHIKQELVDKLKEEAFLPLKKERGISPESLQDEFDSFLSPGKISVFRTQKTLKAILSKVERCREKVTELAASDMRSLVKANKLKNLIACAELAFRASLEREESRSYHIRADFPYRDDINWLKWIILRREGEDGISINRFPLPLYRWKVKPQTYEKIPYSFPLPKVEEQK